MTPRSRLVHQEDTSQPQSCAPPALPQPHLLPHQAAPHQAAHHQAPHQVSSGDCVDWMVSSTSAGVVIPADLGLSFSPVAVVF